jgi:hypothetical protein
MKTDGVLELARKEIAADVVPACVRCYHYTDGEKCLVHHPRRPHPIYGYSIYEKYDHCWSMRKPVTRWHPNRCGVYARFYLPSDQPESQ